MSEIRTESMRVRRTALLALRGPEGAALRDVREVWYVLHGYLMRAVPFLTDCAAIDDGTRLIIAPEALSRFYEGDLSTVAHRTAAVGASWMTRDEREQEIQDYTDYLNDLHALITARLMGARPPVTVLGFSQGGATAVRWVAAGEVKPKRLIVWGSTMPPDVDLGPGSVLRSAQTTFVAGESDRYITKKIVDGEMERFRGAGFPVNLRTYAGGHRLDDDTLRALASGG